MMRLRLVPDKTSIGFMERRKVAFAVSLVAIVVSIVLFAVRGLNYGIDFRGGILIEIETSTAIDLGAMRDSLRGLDLGQITLQEFGAPEDVLIRIEKQKGDEAAQLAAIEAVKSLLAEEIGEGVDYRRTEFVGPKVGRELIASGIKAVVYSLIAMMIYIWFRFEWQFSIGAVAALIHDVVLTIGMFAATGMEFNLATVAAILLIVGYSLNDTVVVYDRIRENLRKYKKLPLTELLDRSINDTLARTVMTSMTTLLALLALYILGGQIIADFSFAMIWGVIVGTYSSIFIAAPILIAFDIRRHGQSTEAKSTP